MSLYNIRFCGREELPKLQAFINLHWRNGHVMGCSKELMEFQHAHEGQDYYDFAVAENKETGEFDAIYGFIRSWKYDTTKAIPSVGWGAIWKVRDDVSNPEIGTIAMQLMKYIILNGDIDILASLGISRDFKKIATSLHFTVGTMNHYYIANDQIKDYHVIVAPQRPNTILESRYSISPIESLSDVGQLDNSLNPFKNLVYFKNRYEKHPFYKYIFWGVYDGDQLVMIFVARSIAVEGHRIFRIVDAMGTTDITKSVYKPIQEILKDAGAEYVDCMNSGIDEMVFDKLGFVKADYDITIVPEHLNPLEHKNIPLEYAYTDEDDIVIFKGDGDQDRPNSKNELCLRS